MHSDRDAIPDVPAVYFVMPTEENIDRMCQVTCMWNVSKESSQQGVWSNPALTRMCLWLAHICQIKYYFAKLPFLSRWKGKHVTCVSERVWDLQRQEVVGTKIPFNIRKSYFNGGGWTLEQIAWRVCGVFIVGEVWNLTGHNPEPLAPFDTGLSGKTGLD